MESQFLTQIQEAQERAQRRISEGEQCVNVEFDNIEDPLAIIEAGFLPDLGWGYPPILADIIALYGTPNGSELINFWYHGRAPDLRTVQLWKFCSIEYYKERGYLYAESLPLLLYAPELVYSKSKRPKTEMFIFRDPLAISVTRDQLRPEGHDFARFTDPKRDEWQLLPVTRYAAGMKRSLFYEKVEPRIDVSEEYCGTFYYLESQSTTYLSFRNLLKARNKAQAVHLLEKQLGRAISPLFEPTVKNPNETIVHPLMTPEQAERFQVDAVSRLKFEEEGKIELMRIRNLLEELRGKYDLTSIRKREVLNQELLTLSEKLKIPRVTDYFPGTEYSPIQYTSMENVQYLLGLSTYPEDLMMTPNEAFRRFPDLFSNLSSNQDAEKVAKLPQIPHYMGILLGLYAKEDYLDQYLCYLAQEAGYDVVLMTHMTGSYQIVSEVLDTRDRNVSFQNLVYVKSESGN